MVALVGTLALSACSPKVDTRGYVRDEEWKKEIIAGKTTRDDVLGKFGSPSSRSSFGEETWYYMSARKETYAFLRSEVADQDVVRITFDPSGVVSKVETYDKSSVQDVKVVDRTTPTEGHTYGFFEQIIGNIGRFNRGSDKDGPGRRGGR